MKFQIPTAYLVTLTVITGFAIQSASAALNEDIAITCNNCTQNQASSAALATTGMYADYHVWAVDYVGEHIWKFHVESEYESGQVWKLSTPESLNSTEQEIFDTWMDYKNLSHIEEVDIPSTVVGSAYDLPGNAANIDSVADYLAQQHFDIYGITVWKTGWASFRALANTLAAEISTNFQPGEVTVNFEDGSSSEWSPFYFEDATGAIDYTFDLIESTLVDSDGNSIPFTSQDAAGTYGTFGPLTGEPNNATRWDALMDRFGVNVGGDNPIPGMRCSFACTVSGGIVNCNLNCQLP